MALFPSLIPWSSQKQTIPYLFLYIENPPILTSPYSGIAIIIYLLSTVSLVPLPIGQKQSALDLTFLIRKYNTFGKLYPSVITLGGLWTRSKVSSLAATRSKVTPRKASQTKGITALAVTTQESSSKDKPSPGHIVIPYTQGIGDSIRKICIKYGIQTHFKGNRNLKQLLVKPKDQDL